MAGFDVDAVESGLRGQPRRRNEGLLQGVQVVIGDYGVVGGQSVERVEDGAAVGDERARKPGRLAVAPGVRELKDQQRLAAPGLRGRAPGLGDQPGKGLDRPLVQPELARVRAGFAEHGGRLEPDQPGAAGRVAAVAAEGEGAGGAVVAGVKALHRVDGKTVGQLETAHSHALAQDAQVGVDRQVEPEAGNLGAQLIQVDDSETDVCAHRSRFPRAGNRCDGRSDGPRSGRKEAIYAWRPPRPRGGRGLRAAAASPSSAE
ncbi:MAG: hypothetical protein BWZ02_02779 [Lentisphaerae bacterium ADurb.BinA184]|nr:MAG: hypothetical protein BWZ02_02779 [Lentisphaerae bacterium ADurb.BinA184]